MIRLQLRLIIAVALVALLAISTGTVLAGPSMQSGSVTVSPTTLTVIEGGSAQQYSVVLGSAPTGDVTIRASVGASTDVKIGTAFPPQELQVDLTFTTENWNMSQSIQAAAPDDALIEGTETHTITHSITATSDTGNYPTTLTISDVTVTVIDTDADVTVSPTTLAVAEAGETTDTYTVVLGRMPAGDVTMTVSSPAYVKVDTDSGTTGNQSALTFTTTNWNTAQTVTVKAVDDDFDDAETRNISIRHRITMTDDTSNYPVSGQPIDNVFVTVTITDNDTSGVTVSETAVTAFEDGATGSYTIKLDTQPLRGEHVTISVTSGDTGNVTVNPLSMTFTATDWANAQTVTVTAVDDDVDDDNSNILNPHQTTITHTASSLDANYHGLSIDSVTATATDNDTAGLTVTQPSTAAIEGGANATYTVKLNSQPTSNVRIRPDVQTNTADVAVTLAFLDFDSSNWATPKTFIVMAVDDDIDDDGESAIIRHRFTSFDSNYTGLAIDGNVTVMITDNDTAGVTLTEISTTAIEGGANASYSIKLDSQPTGPVTIRPTVTTNAADVTVTPGTHMFSTSDWADPKTFTVWAFDDDIDDDGESATITHSSTSSDSKYESIGIDSVTVSITDDDTRGVTISPTAVAVTEAAGSSRTAEYTVVLDSQPTSQVTITFSGHNGGDFSTNRSSVVFTTGNWNSTQPVTVIAADDRIDEDEETQTIGHAVMGGDYGSNGVTADDVTVTITDNDTRGLDIPQLGGLLLINTPEGSRAQYSLRLLSQPTTTVTVNITADSGRFTFEPAAPTFDASNWNIYKTITARNPEDDIDRDAITETIRHTANGGDYANVTFDGRIRFMDNDTSAVIIDPTSIRVSEEGSGTINVKLDTQPAGDVTVTLATTSMDFTLSNAAKTFSMTTWDVVQPVTVTAPNDLDAIHETGSITVAVSSASDAKYNAVTHADISVTINDNDTAGLEVTYSGTTLFIDEDGGTATFEVGPVTQPVGTDDLILTITSDPPGIVTIDTDDVMAGDQNTLTFTSTVWDKGLPVTLTGVNDDIDNSGSTRTTMITIDPSGADYGMVDDSTVPVTLMNDDFRGVTLAADTLMLPSGTVPEDDSRTYTIVLDTEPSEGSVVITPTSNDTDVVTVSPADLTFNKTGSNIWSTPQTVTVMGVNNDIDHLINQVQMTTISHTVTATGDYLGEAVGDVGPVTVTDNDTRGVTVSQTTDLMMDEGTTTTYTIVLKTEPTADVLIHIGGAPNDPYVDFSPRSHNFTPSNWDVLLEVTIEAIDNDIDHPTDKTVTNFQLIDRGGSDYTSGSVTIDSFRVTVNDPDDMRGVILSKTAETIDEGGFTTYTIKLNSQPTMGTVEISLESDTTEVTVSPGMVAFESSNWGTNQTINIRTRADDYDEDNETGTISYRVTGADYESENVMISPFVVTQTDDDTRGITVSESALTILENNTDTYTVVLQSAPEGGPVAITPSSTSIADVTFMPPSLSFTDSNWNMEQIITVMAVSDRIDEDTYTYTGTDPNTGEMWAITHAVVGADYGVNNVAASSVTVNVRDDDTRGVTVIPTSLNITEKSSQDYSVVLLSQPTLDVTIAITKTGEPTLSAGPSSLTFTTTNWEISQSVTVTAADDNDSASNETAIFTNAVSGGDYTTNSVTADPVTVTTVDNDSNNVSVSTGAVTFSEGVSATYTVQLTVDPEQTVLLDASLTNTTGDNVVNVFLPTSTIRFTGGMTGTWDEPQTITVEARVDDDGVGERATIEHRITSGNYPVMGTIGSVTVTVDDPDIQGVMIVGTAFIIEEGAEDLYTVELDTQPVGRDCRVTVTVVNPNPGDLNATPSLTFSAANWNFPQVVTLAPVDDDIDDDGESVTLTHRVTAMNCADYGSVTADTVSVDIDDNDERGVTVSETTREFTEELTSTYTVVLDSEPLEGVTIDVVSNNQTKVTVNPSRLTFIPENWSSPQTVTVGAPHDPDVDDEMATIEHTVAGSDYGSETATDVSVTINDDDMEGITISPTRLRFVEGGTAVYEVVLQTQPSVDQTVTIDVADDSPLVRATPEQLIFERDTWDIPQRVTVQSLTDADELNDIVNIRHTVNNYGRIMEADPVEATVAEFELEDLAELGRPAGLTATARTGMITLQWKAPVPNEDGRVPTSYEYRYTPTVLDDYESSYSSGSGWIRAGGSTARFVQVSGLINLAEYTFQVRGVDSILLAEADSDEDLSTMLETEGTYIHRTKGC